MKIITAGRAAALLIGFLRGLPKGRTRVIVPANVCEVVRQAVLTAGCEPVWCDIDPQTLCLDLCQAERLLVADPTIGGLLFCHTYGTAFWPESELSALKRRHGLALIDDRAAMFPSTEAPEAPSADLILFSTGYAKCVSFPEGGGLAYLAKGYDLRLLPEEAQADADAIAFLKVHSDAPADWLRSHRWFPVHCPMATDVYLDRIREAVPVAWAHKQRLNAIYDESLARWKIPGDFHAWRYAIRVPAAKREAVRAAIFEKGLFASAHYQPLSPVGDTPVAQALADTVLNLFNDGYFTETQACACVDVIVETLTDKQ